MEVMQFLAIHYSELCAMAHKRAMGRLHVEEMLLDEALDRVPRAIELYDSSFGTTLQQYVFDSVRRYMIKKLMQLKHVHCNEEHIAAGASTAFHFNLDDEEEVQHILKDLHPYHAWLLRTYHQGFNFTEIAESLGVSKGTIRNHYYAALEQARAKCLGAEKVAQKAIGEGKHLMATQDNAKQS